MLLRKKKPAIKILRIAMQEWNEDDAATIKHLVGSPTWPKLVAVLNGYLVEYILYRGAGDDYRLGYLKAIEDIHRIGIVEKEQKDSREFTSMCGLDDEE